MGSTAPSPTFTMPREAFPVEQGALAYVASQLRGLARNPALSDSERDAVHHVERLLMHRVQANRDGGQSRDNG